MPAAELRDHAGPAPATGGTSAGGSGALPLGLLALSVLLLLGTGVLGPSATQPPLGPRTAAPPYHLGVDPSAWLVTALLWAGLLAGAAGTALALRALRRGWAPDPRPLLAAGAVAVLALVLVPPMGSADHLSYAAYGRIAAAGDDPYAVAPERWRRGLDPVAGAVEAPWRWAPSVYGPLATAEQALAARLGGGSLGLTVLVLSLLNAAAVLAVAVLLHRTARGPAARARAALLWLGNPLVLWLLVAGAHVDAVAVALGVAGLAALRRSAALSGLALGLAATVKAPMLLYLAAVVWALRRAPARAAAAVVVAAATALPGYLLAGPHVLDQLRRASRYVSLATPWNLVKQPLDAGLGDASRPVVSLLAALATAALVVVLARVAPRLPADAPLPERAARTAVVLVGAWLLAAAYVLPWYDAMLWAPLALLPASRLDLLVLARGTLLAAAYVPGRVVELPAGLAGLTLGLRRLVTPVAQLALLLALVRWAVRAPAGRSRRARAR